MSIAKLIIASFVAPIATLLLPLLLALSEIYVEQGVVPLDQINDGVMRSAGLFIIYGAPICYALAAVFYAAAGHVLVRARKVGLVSWLVISAAAPWVFVALAALGLVQNNHNIGGGLFVLGVLGLFSSAFASIGAAVWWAIAVPRNQPPNPSLQRTAFGSR